jgi:hypothetical protein
MSIYCQYVIHILLRKIIKLVRVSDISANKEKYFSEVGFEPTPTFVDQNALQNRFTICQQQTNQARVWRLRPLDHPDKLVT